MEDKSMTAKNIAAVLTAMNPGKSIAQMSREIGLNPLTLGNTINGKTTPSHGTLSAIANYCGVTVDALVKGEVAEAPEEAQQEEERPRELYGDDLLLGFREGWRNGFAEGYKRGFEDRPVTTLAMTDAATTLN